MPENPPRLIARLAWGEPPPSQEDAAAAEISHWMLPARITPTGDLELAAHAEQLPAGCFSLEWQIDAALSPAAERHAAGLFRPWLNHPRALRIAGRPLLWIADPERLSHPHFSLRRFAPALLLAAAPPERSGFEGLYERSDRLPCLELEDGLRHYESYLFHAHHRPVGQADLVVPCVSAQPERPMAFANATNYREWLALSCAWSHLRHKQPDQRLVLVEHWQGHRRWHQPSAPSATHTPADAEPIPPCQERRWGVMDANRPALLVHGFYLDLLEAMLEPIVPGIEGALPLALYVSTPIAQLEVVEALLHQQGWDQVCLVGTPNRGRDIAPFLLELLPRVLRAGHPWLVKLHTKRSLQTPGGEAWGRQLIDQLASPAALKQLQTFFSAPDAPALVAPSDAMLATTVCLSGNSHHLEALLQRQQIDPVWWLGHTFVAGSMWAARSSVLKPLLKLVEGWEAFEPETGQINGTLAHAIERLVPAVINVLGASTTCVAARSTGWTSPFGHPWAKPRTPD
jgi:hypothetical protein